MNGQIHASFQVNDHLQQVIDDKMNKLDRYFNRITQIDLYLKIGEKRHRQAEDQIAELKVEIPGYTFFAEDHSDSFEKAVAGVTDKIIQQIKKYKGQHYSHH
jgi:putative sigma-54 modulation protein